MNADSILYPPRRLRTMNEQGTIPVPDGLVLHRVEKVSWTIPTGGSLLSDEVHYTHIDPAEVELDEACAIVVNTDTGAYELRNMMEDEGPWEIHYVLSETRWPEEKGEKDASTGLPDFYCEGPGILRDGGWYIPEEGDLIAVRNMTVDEEGDSVGFEQGEERIIRVTSVERVDEHQHRIEGSYVEDP